MTREELRKRLQDYSRTGNWIATGVLVFFFALLISAGLLTSRAPKNDPIGFIWPVIMLVIMPASFFVMYRVGKRRSRQHSLTCPHCGRVLAGTPAPIVIASGRCCYCGHAVISDL